jgi:GNAT superfamily N-acetyltransferase
VESKLRPSIAQTGDHGQDLKIVFKREFKRAVMDSPYIDYSFVKEDYTRQGLATQLYKTAASFYAQKGLTLRSSTLQSEPVKALWASFEQKGWAQDKRLGQHTVKVLAP